MGHALIVGGRYGMAGAVTLAAHACLRSGVGKVTVHTPRLNNDIIQTTIPEAVLSHDVDNTIITKIPDIHAFDSIAIGPGIGTEQPTVEALRSLFLTKPKKIVIDADAINMMAEHRDLIDIIPESSILTPHPKEFERLIGIHLTTRKEQINLAKDFATTHNSIIVLKGHNTAITSSDGAVQLNPTGNPGMATAGSGDVLTGVICALLARGCSPINACILGTFIHGLAGDLAVKKFTEESLIASDIINALPEAFRQIMNKQTSLI